MAFWTPQVLFDVQKMTYKWTAPILDLTGGDPSFPLNHESQPCKQSGYKASGSLLIESRFVSLRKQPTSGLWAFLATLGSTLWPTWRFTFPH